MQRQFYQYYKKKAIFLTHPKQTDKCCLLEKNMRRSECLYIQALWFTQDKKEGRGNFCTISARN